MNTLSGGKITVYSRVLDSYYFYVVVLIAFGIGLVDYGVTKFWHNSVMKKYYPPATEEEFLTEVYNENPHSYVRQVAYEPMLQRSNTKNFEDYLAEDHSNEDDDGNPKDKKLSN